MLSAVLGAAAAVLAFVIAYEVASAPGFSNLFLSEKSGYELSASKLVVVCKSSPCIYTGNADLL
jgi:hypothetical protein